MESAHRPMAWCTTLPKTRKVGQTNKNIRSPAFLHHFHKAPKESHISLTTNLFPFLGFFGSMFGKKGKGTDSGENYYDNIEARNGQYDVPPGRPPPLPERSIRRGGKRKLQSGTTQSVKRLHLVITVRVKSDVQVIHIRHLHARRFSRALTMFLRFLYAAQFSMCQRDTSRLLVIHPCFSTKLVMRHFLSSRCENGITMQVPTFTFLFATNSSPLYIPYRAALHAPASDTTQYWSDMHQKRPSAFALSPNNVHISSSIIYFSFCLSGAQVTECVFTAVDTTTTTGTRFFEFKRKIQPTLKSILHSASLLLQSVIFIRFIHSFPPSLSCINSTLNLFSSENNKLVKQCQGVFSALFWRNSQAETMAYLFWTHGKSASKDSFPLSCARGREGVGLGPQFRADTTWIAASLIKLLSQHWAIHFSQCIALFFLHCGVLQIVQQVNAIFVLNWHGSELNHIPLCSQQPFAWFLRRREWRNRPEEQATCLSVWSPPCAAHQDRPRRQRRTRVRRTGRSRLQPFRPQEKNGAERQNQQSVVRWKLQSNPSLIEFVQQNFNLC